MGFLYTHGMRPILFSFDSEKIHDVLLNALKIARRRPLTDLIHACASVSDPRLAVNVAGITFPNPVGLAAGFDKNAQAFEFFEACSFGHIEVGTITNIAQEGNPKPRIFRLPQDAALINRMGFPSIGIDAVIERLRELGVKRKRAIFGINIGKSKVTPIDDAAEDYLKLFQRVESYADYVALNVSSPNTPDLRKLQEPGRLVALFKLLRSHNSTKPLFVKVAPDLTDAELDEIVTVCFEAGIGGLIATNTTISRDGIKTQIDEAGGLSGAPLRERSRNVVRRLYKRTEGRMPIIGVGGISTADDVISMVKCGASITQLYTSLIYEGPYVAYSILKGILSFMEREGIKSLDEIRGAT